MKLWNKKWIFWSPSITSWKALADKAMLILRLSWLFLKKDWLIMKWLKRNLTRLLCMLLVIVEILVKDMKLEMHWFRLLHRLLLPRRGEFSRVYCLLIDCSKSKEKLNSCRVKWRLWKRKSSHLKLIKGCRSASLSVLANLNLIFSLK